MAILERRYPRIPVQMCLFHQVQIVLRYTTRNPKTESEFELKKLILTLKNTTKKEFLHEYIINPITGRKNYSHKSLRSAFRSINSHLNYLFTFQDFPELNIQPTSNSCDGHFSHGKPKVKLHKDISPTRKTQIITKFLGYIEV
jgi:hypothetical protein